MPDVSRPAPTAIGRAKMVELLSMMFCALRSCTYAGYGVCVEPDDAVRA
ncbi:hypothetical protein [Streptomyces sp. MMG1533]|nr:hypothetical protein [Streptomyces sp. MMG1533]